MLVSLIIYICHFYIFKIFFFYLAILAVVDALKTLQQKIRKLEVERMQAQKSYQDVSQSFQPEATTQSETEKCSRKGQ